MKPPLRLRPSLAAPLSTRALPLVLAATMVGLLAPLAHAQEGTRCLTDSTMAAGIEQSGALADTVRALVIFVRFPDDFTYNHPYGDC